MLFEEIKYSLAGQGAIAEVIRKGHTKYIKEIDDLYAVLAKR
jgi:hypothetical protein